MVYKYDFLIIGAGVAGMSYALKVARELQTRNEERGTRILFQQKNPIRKKRQQTYLLPRSSFLVPRFTL